MIGIGSNSQWGKIKSSLMVDAVNTPLQDKLEVMTSQVALHCAHVAAGLVHWVSFPPKDWIHRHGCGDRHVHRSGVQHLASGPWRGCRARIRQRLHFVRHGGGGGHS